MLKNHTQHQGRLFRIVLLLLFWFLVCILSAQTADAAENTKELAEKLRKAGEEDLLMFFDPNEIITGVGTLTATPRRTIPAATTRITQQMIRSSGARDLFELLDIYVPNLQWIRHNWQPTNMGLRGLISDRDEKYLLLVNGRVMNERTHYGAFSERDLVMLDDIEHIDVIRGPGSMIYGLGAVSMVISIVTENATTFQGTAATGKAGFFEEFYSGEIKHGKVFSKDTSLYLYAGFSEYLGARQKDSPLVFGSDGITQWDLPIERGVVKYGINRDQAAYRGLPHLKFHAELKHKDFDFWIRYTRGGRQYSLAQGTVMAYQRYDDVNEVWYYKEDNKHPEYFTNQPGNGYQQLTAYGSYHQEVSDTLTMDYALSYDMFDYEKTYYRADYLVGEGYTWCFSHREDEYLAKALARWTPNSRHSVALGVENSYEIFGLRSPGFPHAKPIIEPEYKVVKGRGTDRWRTYTFSVFGEHQWNINEEWTTFLGTRLDKGTYTNPMYSHRASAVHTPTDQDTFKVLLSRSVRQGFVEDMRVDRRKVSGHNKAERLHSLELRYEREHTNELRMATSFFWHDLEVSSWNSSAKKVDIVGEEELWGFEAEASYNTERMQVLFSHGYVKLSDFELAEAGLGQNITSKPYGYGDDLANWSNHVTKLYAKYKLTPQWNIDGSLRVYWGFPGARDHVDRYYEQSVAASTPKKRSLRAPGYNAPYEQSIFLNLGLEYNKTENLQVRLDGYGLLGWLDKDFNKRLFYGTDSSYRSRAAALALTVRYYF